MTTGSAPWRSSPGAKSRPRSGCCLEHAERVGGEPGAARLFRQRAVVADVHRGVAERREAGEGRGSARASPASSACETLARRPDAVLPREHVEPVRVLERQPPEERGIHDGEAGRVDADAERQRDDGRGRKPAFLGDQAEGKAQILQDAVDEPAARGPSRCCSLIEAGRPRESAPRGAPVPGVMPRRTLSSVSIARCDSSSCSKSRSRSRVRKNARSRAAISFSAVDHHHLRVSSSSSRPMTPETRSQFSVSAASCFRPALEME